ncbi:cytochrome o ubiquinol oxidase subunit IV [Erythrobacter sp. NE805]|uniref:cytochrome o ubiquinol oxidase subunit IV n=1 Tax=Erythrobacter sp. NE805 TaxID=3389875 RepID=UPI00396B1C64
MSAEPESRERDTADAPPGDEQLNAREFGGGLASYLGGLLLAALLTGMSFLVLDVDFVWGPAVPMALIVLAVAQMGVHLVFFLHVTTGPDNTNNVLALAFGVMVCALVLFGSIWIMAHLAHGAMAADMASAA